MGLIREMSNDYHIIGELSIILSLPLIKSFYTFNQLFPFDILFSICYKIPPEWVLNQRGDKIMKSTKLFILLVASFITSNAFALTLYEGQSRRVNGTLVRCKRHVESDADKKCKRPCIVRNQWGRCEQYGEAFCAYKAKCIARCASWNVHNRCERYAADFCGGEFTRCRKRCVKRDRWGDCKKIGMDACGDNITCRRFCKRYDNFGDCIEYGADKCF